MNRNGVLAIARLSFRQSATTRLTLIWLAIFFLLSANLPILFAIATRLLPPDYAPANLPNFITISFSFLPLLALLLGSTSIAEERESGTLQFLLSHPISMSDFFLGRWLGLALSTSLMVALGYGAASVLVFGTDLAGYASVLTIIVIGVALISMLGLALVLSTIANRKMSALAVAIALWIFLTYLTQLGIIDIANSFQNGGYLVLLIILLNPVETAGLLAALTGGTGYSNLGIAGQFIKETIGDSLGSQVLYVLAIDILAFLVLYFSMGYLIFTRQEPFYGGKVGYRPKSPGLVRKVSIGFLAFLLILGAYYGLTYSQNSSMSSPARVQVSGIVNPTGFAGIPLNVYFTSPGRPEVSTSVFPGGHYELLLANKFSYNVTLLYRDLNYYTYYCNLGTLSLDSQTNSTTFSATC